MAFAPKTSIGRYEIISPLGKGGMGEVYLAHDDRLDRKVAIKFLNKEFSEDADKLNRFIQEAKAASALNHPNILTVYEIGENDGVHFIVTESIDGKTLSDVLADGRLEIGKAINYAIQIASALAAAHDAGIIHRDIKANNTMIRSDGIAKLLDFGLAKLAASNDASDVDSEAATIARVMTVPGMVLGTPNYMSPEQARGQILDARTDIFSFGIMFFEMLTGRRPFDGETVPDTLGAILKDEAPPLSYYIENAAPDLEHIVGKMLRKDREKRFQDVKDLVIDLKDLRDNLKFEAKLIHSTNSTKYNLIHNTDTANSPSTVQIDATLTKRRSFSAFQVAGLLVAIATVVIGTWWLTGRTANVASDLPQLALKKTDIVSWNSAPGELFSTGKFSPDGKLVAYSSTKSGSKNIWIKQPETGSAVQVTKDLFSNQNPIWSPKGDEIAFFSERGNQGAESGNSTGIWRIPTLGGTPVSVAAVGDGSSQLKKWSKSGKIYYESGRNLFSVEVVGGSSVQITDFAPDSQTKFIDISSDETKIAYTAKVGYVEKIFTRDLSGGEPIEISESSSRVNSLVWHPDNKRVLFSALVDGAIQIFVASESGKKPLQITFSESSSEVVDISADGSAILFGSAKEESNLWKIETETNSEIAFSSSIESELWADVSKQTGRIVFQSVKNLSQGNNLMNGSILIKSASASAQPLRLAENGFLPTFSPSGKTVAFMRQDGQNVQIWAVQAIGGNEVKLTEGGIPGIGYSVSPYNRIQTEDFSWSPDGTSITYVSNRNGFSNIWRVTADNSSDIILTNNVDANTNYYCPVWSGEGKSLAYSAKSHNAEGQSNYRFWVMDTESKQSAMVYQSNLARLIGWSKDAQGLIIAEPSKFSSLPSTIDLREANITSGEVSKIAELKDTYYYNLRISDDRKSIGYVAHQDSKDDLWVIGSNGGKATQLTNNNDPNQYFSSISWSPSGNEIYFGKQTRYSLLSMLTNFQ